MKTNRLKWAATVLLVLMMGGALWGSGVYSPARTDNPGSPQKGTSLASELTAGSRGLPTDHPTLSVAPTVLQDREKYQEALRENPSDTEALLGLGTLLLQSHDPQKAIGLYEDYLNLKPTDRNAWMYLANAHAATQNWRAAAKTSRRMLDVLPDDVGGLYNLAAAEANLGNYDVAQGIWEQVSTGADPVLQTKAKTALQQLAAR